MSNLIGTISGSDWSQALKDAQKDGLLCFNNDKPVKVFHPERKDQIGNNNQLSIKEISEISKEIFDRIEDKEIKKNIKEKTSLLIKQESKKIRGQVKKTHAFWLNAAKWISFVSLVFSPIGFAIRRKQQQAEKELKAIQNLQTEWSRKNITNTLTVWEQKTIGKALSQKTWQAGTDLASNFKNVLQEAIIKEPLVSLNQNHPSTKIPEQGLKDFKRSPKIQLNDRLIYSNINSSPEKEAEGFQALLTAFNETAEDHSITNGVLTALSQTLTAQITNYMSNETQDGFHHGQANEFMIYNINIHENQIIIEIKTLFSERIIENPNWVCTMRATSQKLTMPIDELKEAVKSIETLKTQKPKEEALKTKLDFLPNLKGEERISNELFKRLPLNNANDLNAYLEQDVELIGINRFGKDSLISNSSNETKFQILNNFNSTSETQGIWNKEEAWERVKKGV